MSNEREDYIFKERRCPICMSSLFFYDFHSLENSEHFGLDKCILLWINDNVQIPCCNCYEIIKWIRKNPEYVVSSYKGGILLSYIKEEFCLSMKGITYRQYEQLKNLGLIDDGII